MWGRFLVIIDRTPYERPHSRRSDQSAGADYMRRLGLPVGGGDSHRQDRQEQWYRIMVRVHVIVLPEMRLNLSN